VSMSEHVNADDVDEQGEASHCDRAPVAPVEVSDMLAHNVLWDFKGILTDLTTAKGFVAASAIDKHRSVHGKTGESHIDQDAHVECIRQIWEAAQRSSTLMGMGNFIRGAAEGPAYTLCLVVLGPVIVGAIFEKCIHADQALAKMATIVEARRF